MLKAFLVLLFLGATFVPVSVSAIGFTGGGPVSPSKPPPSLSPFSPQPQSPEEQQAAQKIVYLCVCDQSYCGNNAISGRYGQIKKDILATDLARKYGPQRMGGDVTGWFCLLQGQYRCECMAETCGNGAVEAKRAKVFEVETVEKVIDDIKPWRTGEQKTGWQCILQEPTGK